MKDNDQPIKDRSIRLNRACEELQAWIYHTANLYCSRMMQRAPDVVKVRNALQSIDTIGGQAEPASDVQAYLAWLASAERIFNKEGSSNDFTTLMSIAGKRRDPVLTPCTAAVLYDSGLHEEVASLVSQYLQDAPRDELFQETIAFAEVLSPSIISLLEHGCVEMIVESFDTPLAAKLLLHPKWSKLRMMVLEAKGK